MPGGGLGWGRVGRGEGLGGGIMTSIQRAHMHKLLAYSIFDNFAWVGHVPP